MNNVVFITLLATGFAVGFLHAVIPTHWLPFVVAARAQHWTRTKTLGVTGFAGIGHTLFTTALGVLVVWGGMTINSRIGSAFPYLAGGALIALGIFYLIRQIKGGHGHVHFLEAIRIINMRRSTQTSTIINLKSTKRWSMKSVRSNRIGRDKDLIGLRSSGCSPC